ncbi:MAG: helix-turn-helix transcriptional regulator [Oscillibacter sp.]|nr:helix-turn-helix transcriptional regulator [Oscillibacter sp.]
MDSGLSVLWISRVIHRKGMYNIVHSHDYFHFAFSSIVNEEEADANAKCIERPLYCFPPNTPHGGGYFCGGGQGINIMFMVEDKAFEKMLEKFPFELVPLNRAHEWLLNQIVELCHRPGVDNGLINVAVSYYLRLVMQDNHELLQPVGAGSLSERCMAYIDKNYMHSITLEDVAHHIGKSRNYTSSIFNNTVGMNLMEYVNSVRIKNACAMIAYSGIPMEEVAYCCGFTNLKHFGRVFKNVVGTTPVRYRTSHATRDCKFKGDEALLKMPYKEEDDMFTYIVDAQKFIKWRTTEEYILQAPRDED